MRGQIAIQLDCPRREELQQIHLIARIISEMAVRFKNRNPHCSNFRSQNHRPSQCLSNAPAHHHHRGCTSTRLFRNDWIVGFDTEHGEEILSAQRVLDETNQNSKETHHPIHHKP